MKLKPIGIIHSPFKEAKGTPIQPAAAAGAEGSVELDAEYAESLADVDGFERIWLIYWFDRAAPYRAKVVPFLDDVERGLFATRAPSRPNPIGMSAVRLDRIEGRTLHIRDVDILDGTPLLDIKPYASRFDRFDVKRCGWMDSATRAPGIADDRFEK